MLLYLIMLLGVVFGFVYTSQSDPAASVLAVPARFQLSTLRGLENLKIDYSLLTSDQFKQLRVFGSLLVQPQGNGTSNPFQ